MPFIPAEITVNNDFLENMRNLEPLGRFDPRTVFNRRISEEETGKRLVALYITEKFSSDGGSAFLTDGSSTFYVGLAIALRSSVFTQSFTLVTNNLAVITELNSRNETPQHLNIEIMGGQLDYGLNATFPTELNASFPMDHGKRLFQNVRLVIVSVRGLFYLDGPTSPDLKSLLLKREALQIHAECIFVTDWKKMTTSHAAPANKILDQLQWDQLLKDLHRTIWIVCAKPTAQTQNTYEMGQRISHQFDPKRKPIEWENAEPFERYCWQAFRFSEHTNVNFVEVTTSDTF
jgi:DeoR/GlpR family transcriptional regulator of sugar metabolism